jgi:hypothetical protein
MTDAGNAKLDRNKRRRTMKKLHFAEGLVGSVALGLALSTAACTKTPEVKKAEIQADANKKIADTRKDENKDVADIKKGEAKDLQKENKSESETNRDTYADDASKRIDALSDRMDKVEKGIDAKSDAVKTVLAAPLADAKAKHDAAKTQLKNLKDADGATWGSIRANVETDIAQFDSAVQTTEQVLQAH